MTLNNQKDRTSHDLCHRILEVKGILLLSASCMMEHHLRR